MRVNTRRHNDVLIIEPRERITDQNEPEFIELVRTLLERGSRRLVVSLAGIPHLDSVGLGAIVQAYTSARRAGGDLKLVHVGHRNRELLTITKILTVLEAYENEDEVERSFETAREDAYGAGADRIVASK